MPPSTPPSLSVLRSRLNAVGQQHLLRFADELRPDQLTKLTSAIERIDLTRVPSDVARFVQSNPSANASSSLRPAPYYPQDHTDPARPWDRAHFHEVGEELLRRGAVAAFTVAGGQGSRLGYDGPKGCYPGGAVTGKPLFSMLAEWLLAADCRYGAPVPWCVMTSPLNHSATELFFQANSHFGLDPSTVRFFQQGVMPTYDRETGRVLLAAKDEPATNPDGHGGSLRALYESGSLDWLSGLGVEHIAYCQIDNPAVRLVDPVFLGLHTSAADSSAEMSSKALLKTDPSERVGVFALRGKSANAPLGIVEYSDMPAELASHRDANGTLSFRAGSPAIHALSVDFVRQINTTKGGLALPLHRADKKVAHVDLATGAPVPLGAIPEPNAIKLEMFVFDALAFCRAPIVVETDRVEEFAPIKNAAGSDSPATSARLQTLRAARWLTAAGVDVPLAPDGQPDCTLELSPLTAMYPEDLAHRTDLPASIDRGASLAF